MRHRAGRHRPKLAGFQGLHAAGAAIERHELDRQLAGGGLGCKFSDNSIRVLAQKLSKIDKIFRIFAMQQFTASRAKQNFGELLEAVAVGPVAIVRHKTIKAIICSPESFHRALGGRSSSEHSIEDRRAARAAQLLVEKNRLIKHQKLAINLLLMAEARRDDLIAQARAEVVRWRRDRLCSADYADRWDDILGRPIGELTQSMCSETLEWAAALRQNSPWHVVELATA